MDSSVFNQTQLLLRPHVARTGRLAQKIVTDAPVPGIAALTAHQLAETALRNDYAFACRLLEQASGEVLGIMAVTQARAIEQPFSYTHGKALRRGNRRVL
jgi:hypothetical protein